MSLNMNNICNTKHCTHDTNVAMFGRAVLSLLGILRYRIMGTGNSNFIIRGGYTEVLFRFYYIDLGG